MPANRMLMTLYFLCIKYNTEAVAAVVATAAAVDVETITSLFFRFVSFEYFRNYIQSRSQFISVTDSIVMPSIELLKCTHRRSVHYTLIDMCGSLVTNCKHDCGYVWVDVCTVQYAFHEKIQSSLQLITIEWKYECHPLQHTHYTFIHTSVVMHVDTTIVVSLIKCCFCYEIETNMKMTASALCYYDRVRAIWICFVLSVIFIFLFLGSSGFITVPNGRNHQSSSSSSDHQHNES